jgi:hypothetical protein
MKDDGACFSHLETVDPDAVIANCTEFLETTGITPFQCGTALLAMGNARLLKKEYGPAIADFDTGIRASPELQTSLRAALALN